MHHSPYGPHGYDVLTIFLLWQGSMCAGWLMHGQRMMNSKEDGSQCS